MPEPLESYLAAIQKSLKLGNATEHTHRPALKALLESLAPTLTATNEPRRIECGAPDFVLTRKADQLVVGYIEAKDIGFSLKEAARSEQIKKRYLPALPNFILTDYLEFIWYVEGKERTRFSLAQAHDNGSLTVEPEATLQTALATLKEFLHHRPISITTAGDLAERLARLAHLIRDSIAASFQLSQASELLTGWREVFAQTLLPELADPGRETEFADMFAQTLAYGLFSARVASSNYKRFTLADAAKLIPRTNPFLRDFFDLITGPKLDDEPFEGYVKDLITLLDAADMGLVLEDFGKGISAGRRHDPVVHFYETFLRAYDPALRELRGVYYTPEPVVSYIVESIDWILRDKFGLKDGLADKSKATFQKLDADGKVLSEEEHHRVLILDPATGTGTFLFEVIEHIREQFEKKHQAGLWPAYVHEHLIPRLYGFELLMAPYAVAHFKLALELEGQHLPELWRANWKYQFRPNERLNIFLTNTLEDIDKVSAQLGPLAILSKEANEAIAIKKHRPVLVVLGNPPYSNFGRQNRNPFILNLLDEYKRGLNEKKINLDDDFIKFVRWAHWRIQQTGQGVIGFITNNVYIDGLTHRRMRQSLLEDFDDIYILNLHGSAKKQEAAPDGSKDDNVFDIMIGVAVIILVRNPTSTKSKRKPKHATVHYADLWGSRKHKYAWLDTNNATTTQWTSFAPDKPDFYFKPRNATYEKEWGTYSNIREIFLVSGNGIKTERDAISIHFEKKSLDVVINNFLLNEISVIRQKYLLGKDSRDWSIERAKDDLFNNKNKKLYQQILYRPFDVRMTWYSGKSKGFIGTPATSLMSHFTLGNNLGFITTRQTKEEFGILATTIISGHKSCAGYDINTVFPLYLYPNGESANADLFEHENGRRPNLSADFIKALEQSVGLKFIPDGRGNLKKTVGPEDIFHYAYAIFHAPTYRTRYAEFLKLDFPRLPLTTDLGLFRRLAECGSQLVGLHTLKVDGPDIVSYDIPGENTVEYVKYIPPKSGANINTPLAGPTGRVFINQDQYFEGIPQAVWEFRIGGYQVAEKWLKDRRERTLTHDEIEHYQKTIAALAATRELMQAIDSIISDHGGWPIR